MPKKLILSCLLVVASLFSNVPEEDTVYFSSTTNLAQKIIGLINDSKETLLIANTALTNSEIINAIYEAKKRGVDVQIIIDNTTLQNQLKGISRLLELLIPIYVHYPLGDTTSQMHQKFMIINNKVVNGSLNYSSNAKNNLENIVVMMSKDLHLSFLKEFWRLKDKSIRFTQEILRRLPIF